METIKNGSKGDAVKILQFRLELTPDGIFGPNTEKAVKEFQKNNGLVSDGIVGPKTWEKLLKMETIRNGSKGTAVKVLQFKLNLTTDGIFGPNTEKAVKEFQSKHGLTPDGIVGPKTWEKLNITSSMVSPETNTVTTPSGLIIENHYLDKSQYYNGSYPVDYVVLHHTAGWDDPYQVIDLWNTDSRGRVATEFVVGGQRSTDGRSIYDGVIARAYPAGNMGGHIGDSGSSYMNMHSCGIELCNMGYVHNGKTYVNTSVTPSQTYTLDKPFRGYTQWHKYSDKQLESLRKLLIYIAERDNIDLHKGLYEWIKNEGVGAFEYHADAYNGKVKKGIVTHANIRKDKYDVHPQPELIDMILSL